jgi:CGNR zinc finger/Putative stress-induced transcription regulator
MVREMCAAPTDESFLLALLNTTPVIDGEPTDVLGDRVRALEWLASAGGDGSDAEWQLVLQVRAALQAVVRADKSPDILASALTGAALIPACAAGEITWTLRVAPDRALAVRAILTWDALAKTSPGRLRPCANDECQLFLIDRSKAGTARWCSMAVCGNRMKARRHYEKARQGSGPDARS